MNDWWKKRKEKTRKHRKKKGEYTFIDFCIDVLLWIPEVLVLPFRMLFWVIRGAGRLIKELVDLA